MAPWHRRRQIALSLSVFSRVALCIWLFCGTGVLHAQVYRCGSSYSHTPCKGGKVVDTSAVLSDPRGPATREIYLCSATPGRTYWSSAHCAERGWRIERIERVAADMPWDEQVAAARQAHQSALQASTVPPQRQLQSPGPAAPPAKAQCVALEEYVKSLDSMGRAGSRYYDLDWVRHERKTTRDQQYRLRC